MRWPGHETARRLGPGPTVLALCAGLVLAGGSAEARRGTPPTCRKGERLAAAKAVRAGLACHARAIKRGRVLDQACLDRVAAKLAKGFGKAERKARRAGGCDVPGDADAAWTAIETAAFDLRTLIGVGVQRSKCDAKLLSALGAEAQRLLKAKAKTAVPDGTKPLDRTAAQSADRVAKAMTKAAKAGDCGGAPDLTTLTTRVQQLAGVAGRLRGRVQAVKRIGFPPSTHGDVLAARDVFEMEGFTVADDGAWIEGPLVPAAGWLVEFGTARARTDLLGNFTIDVPLQTPLGGKIYHPVSDTAALAPASLVQLAGDGEVPIPFLFEVTTDGPCGMNESADDDPPHCSDGAAASVAAADRVLARAVNPDPDVYPPIMQGELGTYPDDDPPQIVCLDYNGWLPQTDRNPIGYPGSTCHIQVCLGCCDNERGDYRPFIGGTVRQYFPGFNDPAFPAAQACVLNHGGRRYCQQIQQGDVAVKVRDTVVTPEIPPPTESPGAALCVGPANPAPLGAAAVAQSPQEFGVEAGEVVEILVHNNGCHGRTNVMREPIAEPLGGTLTGAGLVGDRLSHFQGTGPTYQADRPLTYTAPPDCAASDRDVITFETDGARATVEFYCDTGVDMTVTFPSNVSEGVPETLRAEVVQRDDTGGTQPLAGVYVELGVTGGTANPTSGLTGSDGVFESQVEAAAGATSIEVVVRAYDMAGGALLAQRMVTATVLENELCFDFSDGYQGWEGGVTESGGWGTVVHLDRNDGSIKLDGVDDDDGDTEPNAWIFREVSLSPEARTLRLDVSAHDRDGADALYRVRLIDAVGSPHTLIDWTQKTGIEGSLTFSTITTSIAAFAGQSVTLYLEQDGNPPGQHEQIYYDNVCIDAATTGTSTTSTTPTTATSTSSTSTTTSTSTTSTSSSSSTSSTTTSSTATTTSSSTTTVPPTGGTFYRLYAASGVDGPVVTLTDDVRSETVDLGTVSRFLIPASVLGSGVVDADAYQTCHDHPGAPFAATASITNIFGGDTITVGDPDAACVPESVTLAAVDNFNCYAASGAAVGQVVSVDDGFNAESVTVGAPVLYCLPASTGGPLVTPTGHLVCYDATTTGGAPGDLPADNEFGQSTVMVGLPTGVCLPSTTTSLVPTP